MTTFSDALDRLAVIGKSVAITSPSVIQIRDCRKYIPMQLPDSEFPFLMIAAHAEAGALGWGMSRQELHMPTLLRIIVGDMTVSKGAEIAHELGYALLDKLIINQTLDGKVSKILGQSVGPLGGLEWPEESGKFWQRFDIVVDLVFEEGKAFAAHTP